MAEGSLTASLESVFTSDSENKVSLAVQDPGHARIPGPSRLQFLALSELQLVTPWVGMPEHR